MKVRRKRSMKEWGAANFCHLLGLKRHQVIKFSSLNFNGDTWISDMWLWPGHIPKLAQIRLRAQDSWLFCFGSLYISRHQGDFTKYVSLFILNVHREIEKILVFFKKYTLILELYNLKMKFQRSNLKKKKDKIRAGITLEGLEIANSISSNHTAQISFRPPKTVRPLHPVLPSSLL